MADSGGDARRARERVAAALRRVKPAGVVALTSKGEVVIALTGSRMRWERAATAVMKCGAHALRLTADAGALLEVVELDHDDDDDATSSGASSSPSSRNVASELAAILKLVIDAQDKAVARQMELVRDVVSGALEVQKASADRASTLERTLTRIASERERALDRTAQELAALAAQNAEDRPTMDPVQEQMMGALLARVMGGSPPTQ